MSEVTGLRVPARDRTQAVPRHPAPVATSGQAGGAGRFEELEAYRGVAALLIVVFHAYQYSREGTGRAEEVYAGSPWHSLFHNLEATVAWFFVLSGFLVFLPIARGAIERGRGHAARGFLIRRAIRIVPPYYLAITLVWAWRFTGGRDQWIDLAEHLTFTQIFDPVRIFWTIGPAWSLSVEVLFYVFLAAVGMLVGAVCRRIEGEARRAGLLAGGSVMLIAGSMAYKWWAAEVAHIPETNFPIWFGPVAKLDLFAIGMLLAVIVVVVRGRVLVAGPMPSILRLAAGALIVVDFLLRPANETVNLYFHTLSGVAFALVLASTVLGPRDSTWGRALTWPPLQYLGLISYSVYLWHEPILIELGKRGILIQSRPELFPLNALILVTLAVVAASVSYAGIERPVLGLRFLFTREGRLAQQYPEEQSRVRGERGVNP